MNDEYLREVELLRSLAQNLKRVVEPLHPDYLAYVHAHNLPMPSTEGIAKTIILPGGQKAFGDLADCFVARSPRIQRGTVHASVLDELFKQLEVFVGRDPVSITVADASGLFDRMLQWFEESATSRRVFVPCVLTPWPAPQFRIGPVEFAFIDDLTNSALVPASGASALDRRGFDDLVKWMREAHGNWLARVPVEGCEKDRAGEVGALAVDLAIVALLLAAPNYGTRDMCRLEARRGFNYKRTLTEQDGYYAAGWARREAGISIGAGTLADILQKRAPIITPSVILCILLSRVPFDGLIWNAPGATLPIGCMKPLPSRWTVLRLRSLKRLWKFYFALRVPKVVLGV